MDSQARLNLVAGLFGNALEWYDFLLYASFSTLFSELFFPTNNTMVSLIATFGVFAIGFLMRPIGGALLGHYADIVGRKHALIVSATIMTSATLIIAFLPTYNQVGILAPLFLTLLRLIQGLAVGGELPGSLTYLIEQQYHTKRGLAGSLVLSTAFLGIVVGSLTAFMLSHYLTKEMLLSYGWRSAYLLGGLLGVLSIYLRIHCKESDVFLTRKPADTFPINILVTHYFSHLTTATLLTGVMAMGNYLLIAFVTTFLVTFQGYTLSNALLANVLALILLTLLIPLAGIVSDQIKRSHLLAAGLISYTMLLFPVFYLLMNQSLLVVVISQLLLAITLAPLNATIPTLIAEMFPTEIRASGTSISYNLGQAIFGGTIPVVSFTLINHTQYYYAPVWYVLVFSLCVILLFFKRR